MLLTCNNEKKTAHPHPGGRELIERAIGTDATTAFFGGVYMHSNAAHNVSTITSSFTIIYEYTLETAPINDAYRCDQTSVPHASFNASTEPYRASSQRRKAAADSGSWLRATWQPYSLFTCHDSSAGCCRYRCASFSTSRTACSRYAEDDGEYC